MKRTVLACMVVAAGLASCNSEQQPAGLNQNEINAKVDSIVGTRIGDLNRLATEDLDRRMAIEVKVKADSMLKLCTEMGVDLKKAAAPPDNTEPTPSNQP